MENPAAAKPPIVVDAELNRELRPEEFYIEQGVLVFTESYHQERGYCCESSPACRHCPWRT